MTITEHLDRISKGRGHIKFVHTLQMAVQPGRRVGNTTRQIDFAVQQILTDKLCVCFDHHQYGRNRLSNERLQKLIVNRIAIEHQDIISRLHYDKEDLIVWLTPPHLEYKKEEDVI